jgi:hypothetical protein
MKRIYHQGRGKTTPAFRWFSFISRSLFLPWPFEQRDSDFYNDKAGTARLRKTHNSWAFEFGTANTPTS